ncbi:MAG: SDR family NAD(P)-dependent oxidoreductase, partial [Clostridia bacterium]|nr:SDR family NAD(P)-dependent oxidoreductase [Clostridia bacterium]
YGSFETLALERELDMINLNISALHILTKLFAAKFLADGSGLIINVASTAGFMMGPLLSSYYATKAYVLRLSEAIDEETRRKNANVRVSVLCPGPVCTGFDKAAGVSSSMKGHTPDYVAKYAVTKALGGKRIIIPGLSNKLLVLFSRFIPSKLLSKINYMIQSTKGR